MILALHAGGGITRATPIPEVNPATGLGPHRPESADGRPLGISP